MIAIILSKMEEQKKNHVDHDYDLGKKKQK